MADQNEVTISDIHGSLARDSPDVYITFRVGDEHAETQVIKNATERISWSEPVTVPANEGGRGSRAKSSDLLVVRAYDKKPLMPDALLGEAMVELSNLSLADSHVAGSGGGANVQVQLLGKGDKFGGALTFTVTSTEGSSVPGGKTWGPQEVHDGQTTAATGALPAAGTGRRSSSNVGDHASTGFTGGGATAFPAQESGKDLHGEHLADFEKGAAGAGAGAGAAAALGSHDRSVKQTGINEQAPQGTGVVGAVKSALGYGTPSEQQQYTSGSSSSAGNQGGGIVGGVKSALGYGTPAEQHQGVTGQEGTHGTTGFGGGGATAFPAQESGKDLHGEHLSDFGKGAAGAGVGAAAATGSHDRSVEQGGVNEQQGSGIVASVKSALGYGTPAEQQQATTASGTSTGNQGGGYLESAKQALGLGATPTTTTTQGQQQETVGPTTGVTGGGAEARPAEAAGAELGGLHLSDYDNQKGSSHATDTGAGGAATGAAAAALGLAGSGHRGADGHQGGLGSGSGSSGQTGALHEGGAGLSGGAASRSPLSGLGTAAGSTGQTGSVHEGGSGLGAGVDTRSPAPHSSTGTVGSSSGRTGMLREGGLAPCNDGTGQTAHLHTHNEPAGGITGAGRSGESGLATGAGQQAAPGVGGGTGADGVSKEQLFLATGIAGAMHEGGRDTATASHGSSDSRGLTAGDTPAAGAATGAMAGAPAGSHTAGQTSSQNDGVLYISGIGGKLARHEDTLGHVSPYFVFEVGRERATTATHAKGIKPLQALTWEDNLELELPQGGTSQELHIIAYNKKHLLPDSRLGEARARLDQLPRGRQARLNLIDHKTRGNMAGDVEFTLTGGGPGGEGAGNDLGMVEGAAGLSTTEHEGVASGAIPPVEERRETLVAEREEKHAQEKAAKGK